MEKNTLTLQALHTLDFEGQVQEQEDLSAIALSQGNLIIGADEGHGIQRLTPHGPHSYQVQDTLNLVDDPDTETDIEDICCQGHICYVVGSHSLKRKKVKANKSQTENRERLYQIPTVEPHREALFQISVDSKTGLSKTAEMSLKNIIQADDLLKPFLNIPSKENGIDIEGLAIRKNRLFVGFRSPVLRGNYVPVLTVETQQLTDPKLSFIQMGGRGIRAMTETEEGFLIIGGPSGDAEMSYNLYFWDGNDMIPGKKSSSAKTLLNLGQLPTAPALKAEGIVVLEETSKRWQVLIMHDGIAGGQPTVYDINKS